MIRTCAYDTQCTRVVRPGFALCDDHTRRVLSRAFSKSPEPQSWHDRARQKVGRPYAWGGQAA